MDHKTLGSWLEGPAAALDNGASGYRGQRLGLPESGANSVAGVGRRLGAILVDWLLSYVIVVGVFRVDYTHMMGQLSVLGLFALENVVLISLLGHTIGKRLFGVHVVRLGAPLTPLAVLLRTVLLCLLIPAVVFDRDTRGLHDRAARTVVVMR